MKYHKQTILDFEKGNCWSTSIACLLDLEIDEVPNFCALGSDTFDCEGNREDWYRRTFLWLKQRGYGLVTLNFPTAPESGIILPDAPAIIGGPSPRHKGKLHVVVGHVENKYIQYEGGMGHSFTVIFDHDPHPDNNFFNGEPPIEINLLVKIA